MRARLGRISVVVAAFVLFGLCAAVIVRHPNVGAVNMPTETSLPPVKLTAKGLYPVSTHPRPIAETELASFAAG